MSVLQRNRVTSFGYLLSSKPGSGTGPQRASASCGGASSLYSLPSCPIFSTAACSEREAHISKRARVTSAPFVRRNGDPVRYGEAHGSHHLPHASKLVPPQVATLSQPPSGTPFNLSSQGQAAPRDISFECPLSLQEAVGTMSTVPHFSFCSPVPQPKMHPLQSDIYAPIPTASLSPRITYLATLDYWNHQWPLSTSQFSSIAAFLEPHRRSPAPESRTTLRLVCSTEDEHVLSVHLPGFAPEMVTISAHREDKLVVVADLWHAEANCHHEWLVAFSSRDANVLQTRAQFSADGTLTIHVPRRKGNIPRMRGRLR